MSLRMTRPRRRPRNSAIYGVVISTLISFLAHAFGSSDIPTEFLPTGATPPPDSQPSSLPASTNSPETTRTAARPPTPPYNLGLEAAPITSLPPSTYTPDEAEEFTFGSGGALAPREAPSSGNIASTPSSGNTAYTPSSEITASGNDDMAGAPSNTAFDPNAWGSDNSPPSEAPSSWADTFGDGPYPPSYPTETKVADTPTPPPPYRGVGAQGEVWEERSPPSSSKSRLSEIGESCGGTPPLICRNGLLCIPNDKEAKAITVNTPGTCRTGYNSEPCSYSVPCKRKDYECLTDKQQPVKESNDKALSQGTCVPRLQNLPSGYLGGLGEQCGNVTRYPPKECTKCNPVVRYLPCIKGLQCIHDTRLYLTQTTYTDRFNVYVVGTCQYPDTGRECTNGVSAAASIEKITTKCRSPLVCVQTYYNWYNTSKQGQTSQCLLPGSGSMCSQSQPCPKPLLCLYVGADAIRASSGRGVCGTWGPNAPILGDVRPIRFDAKPNDRCDVGQPVTCPSGYGCGKDPNRRNSTAERNNYYCIEASPAAALFSYMRYVWSISGAMLIAFIFL